CHNKTRSACPMSSPCGQRAAGAQRARIDVADGASQSTADAKGRKLMRRRIFLGLASALLAAGLAGEAAAQAQSWPDKPVKLILPYAPGGATDLIGRPWAEKLGQVFGQQFVIENRGGAGGMIGTEAA